MYHECTTSVRRRNFLISSIFISRLAYDESIPSACLFSLHFIRHLTRSFHRALSTTYRTTINDVRYRIVAIVSHRHHAPLVPLVIVTRLIYQRRVHRSFIVVGALSYPGGLQDRLLDRTGSNWIGAVGSRDVRVTLLGRRRKYILAN